MRGRDRGHGERLLTADYRASSSRVAARASTGNQRGEREEADSAEQIAGEDDGQEKLLEFTHVIGAVVRRTPRGGARPAHSTILNGTAAITFSQSIRIAPPDGVTSVNIHVS